MLLGALFLIVLASVPLAGGRLVRLADLQFRRTWTILASLLAQIVVIELVPAGAPAAHQVVHVGTYALAAVFIASNRHIPGMLLMGAGGAVNAVAIAVNGGIMPARAAAVHAAGLTPPADHFNNSAVVHDAHLQWLGDVFAVPSWMPLANVFSVGDVLLIAGAFAGVHAICGSRIATLPRRARALAREHPGVGSLLAAQTTSTLGDWVLMIAVLAHVASTGGGATSIAVLLVAQFLPAAITGFAGGGLLDRGSRRRLLIATDVARAVAVASLLLAGEPGLLHLAAVGVVLGSAGALSESGVLASLPDLVPRARLGEANALMTSASNTALMCGPALGGLLVGAAGTAGAFAVDVGSFLISAVLLTRVRLPRVHAGAAGGPALSDVRGGLRAALAPGVVRAAVAAMAAVITGAAIKGVAEPLFVVRVLDRPASALGVAGAAWGLGMVLGAASAPALLRRLAPGAVLALAMGVAGSAVIAASLAPGIALLCGCWAVAGVANGTGAVAYQTLLQAEAPEALRGRVMAASTAVTDGAYLVGALGGGLLVATAGVRPALALAGGLFLAAAVVLHRRAAPRATAAGDAAAPVVALPARETRTQRAA